MALMLLRVFLVGVFAAAADDVPITWWPNNHAVLPCVVPLQDRLQARRPPPPIDDDRPRAWTYMWRKGDKEVNDKRVLPSGSLEVSRRVRKEGEGVYQCMVRHLGGIVLGYPTHLKFALLEKQFVEQPEDATARIGQPFVLSCNISSAPPATVSWLRDDQLLPYNERYHVLQNNLLITDVTSADEGSYRCVATNPQLNKSRSSHAATLVVQSGAGDQDTAFLPVNHEANIAAPRGTRIVLPCPVTGWPRPKMIWELTPPGERKSELDVVDEVFVIRSLQQDQEGVYTCAVEGNSDLVKTFSVTLTEPAKITIPPNSREALRASTVRFNCTAIGRPEPNVTWYKDGQPLQVAGRINLRTSTDGQRTELVISGVTSDDAGVYQCFAQNPSATDSFWAMLNVTGADAAAPTNVRCWAVGDKRIKVMWEEPAIGEVVAYTVHGTSEDEKAGNSLPGHPLQKTEEVVEVKAPLIPYRFQVRAYSRVVKSAASDMSAPATCQGQGIPIKMAKLENNRVIVSWKEFAKETPEVVQWILQTMRENTNEEHNVTLDGSIYNYTLSASPSQPLQVRVLGSRTLSWLHQDLSLVPWSSTASAGDDLDSGDVTVVPDKIEVSDLTSRQFTVTWRCGDAAGSKYTYLVCVKGEDLEQTCVERKETFATFEELQPGTQYKVLVQARLPNRALGGPFSPPYLIITPVESPQSFRNLSAKHVNSSQILVSWNGAPAHYKVHYSAQLKLPVEQWASVETETNSVLVPVIDPAQRTYLMVTSFDPPGHSIIQTVPAYVATDLELHHEITASGIRVWWKGDKPRVVSYAQNITAPLEQWNNVSVKGNSVVLSVNLSLPTYVMVSEGTNRQGPMLTIHPQPLEPSQEEDGDQDQRRGQKDQQEGGQEDQQKGSSLYIVLGVLLGALLLALFTVAAVCIWRRRKRAHSPVRSRRRNLESNEDNVEEEAEMKAVGGASGTSVAGPRTRLPNGGARGAGAGEPLLNGHVHITDNPTSKTPNGKTKKGRRYEAAFDVSRYEDPDATQETVLDADSSTASYNLLDTSRRPEYDVSRSSREISANNSFAKLPDDNMNSEVTRSSFQLDNSKVQPTLQPNG